MPELPEVESLRRSLKPLIEGGLVEACVVRRADVCTSHSGGAITAAELLAGQRIRELVRHGKQMAMVGSSGTVVCVHLGMSGQIRVSSAVVLNDPHVHIQWKMGPSQFMVFRDPRRFGGIWTFPSTTMLQEARWSELGPDALRVTGSDLAGVARWSNRAVKAILLDQRLVAGVGNIYADESLFQAGIHPQQPACDLSKDLWNTLASCVVRVLADAVEHGGSTLRDYKDASGVSGSAQHGHKVYGRSGQPCSTCSTQLDRTQVVQRTTVWCPQCQPFRRGNAGT